MGAGRCEQGGGSQDLAVLAGSLRKVLAQPVDAGPGELLRQRIVEIGQLCRITIRLRTTTTTLREGRFQESLRISRAQGPATNSCNSKPPSQDGRTGGGNVVRHVPSLPRRAANVSEDACHTSFIPIKPAPVRTLHRGQDVGVRPFEHAAVSVVIRRSPIVSLTDHQSCRATRGARPIRRWPRRNVTLPRAIMSWLISTSKSFSTELIVIA